MPPSLPPEVARDGSADMCSAERRLRALAIAITTVVLAVGAHITGDGTMPPIPVLIPVAVAITVIVRRISGRQIQRWQFLALLGSAQLAVHLLSSVVAMSHGADTVTVNPVAMVAGHVASTLVTALTLSIGERVWWLVRSWIRRNIPGTYCPPPVISGGTRRIIDYSVKIKPWPSTGSVEMRAPPWSSQIELSSCK